MKGRFRSDRYARYPIPRKQVQNPEVLVHILAAAMMREAGRLLLLAEIKRTRVETF